MMIARCRAIALSLLSFSALSAQTAPPAATVEVVSRRFMAEALAYHIPKLSPSGRKVDNLNLTIGHMQLRLTKGIAAYIEADGKAQGIYYKGEGSFSYLSADPVEHAVLRFNLQGNSKLVPTESTTGLTVGDTVKEVVIWFGGRANPELKGEPIEAPVEAYKATQEYFSSRETTLPPFVTQELKRLPLGQLMAYRQLNAPDRTVISAEITGGLEHYVYTYDEARSHLESLFIQKPKTRGAIDQTPAIYVSAQPIGWARQAPKDPDFRLAHIDVDLVASKKVEASMTLKETIQVIRPNTRALSFYFSNLKAGYGGFSDAKLQHARVNRILTENGEELDFDLRCGFLLVNLRKPYGNGQTLKLTFELDGGLLSREGNDSYWRLSPGEGWMPEPDMAGTSYTVHAKIAIEKPYLAIASAKTIARTETATHNVLEAALDKPTLWFSVAGGAYKPLEMVKNGRTVRAWGYSGTGVGAERLLKTAHGILEYYQLLFGNVPFEEINLVEMPFNGLGQAPAGMIWLTKEAFNPLADEDSRFIAGLGPAGWVNHMVAHEIGHQYWAHQVKMWDFEDQWITESFAEFSSALALRAMKGKGPGAYDRIVRDWRDKAEGATKAASIPTANYLAPGPNTKEDNARRFRQDLVYNKGAYLLACLHHEIGEANFVKFLRAYQKNFAWYPPSYSQDIPGLLKAITGKDFQPWFNKYYWGTELPEWKP